MSLVEVKNLSISFNSARGKVQAVNDVSFEIGENECVALVGESGCGKSVTARSLIGLTEVTGGKVDEASQINFEGKNILDFSDAEWEEYRGTKASMIFQGAMSTMNPTMKIGAQIAECFTFHQEISKEEARNRAVSMLELVGIPDAKDAMNRYPHEFSGGMRQRVMIAAALACNPSLLVADEPTTALDVTIQAQILELISELKEKEKMSVLLITHDMGVVAGLAQRVIVFYAGRVMEMGSIDEIFESPMHPYTKGLLEASPRLDEVGQGALYTIKGAPPELINPKPGCPFAERCPFATEECTSEVPQMKDVRGTHRVACFHAQEVK